MKQFVPSVIRIRPKKLGQVPITRIIAFSLAVLIGGIAIAWIHSSVRQSMQDLERDFGAIQTERFYQAVRVRSQLLNLNNLLLEYQVTGDRWSLIQFRTEAGELRNWLYERILDSDIEEERQMHRQITESFNRYLIDTRSLYERSGILTPAGKRMDDTSQALEEFSSPVIRLCERMMLKQSGSFATFLNSSQQTLDSLQMWIQISLILLLVLALSVAFMVYREIIAPLQTQLSESQEIIARQEKLASLGSLAAGVAHEIRNPLTAIKCRLFSLKKSLPPSIANNEDISVISSEINRLDRIVRDFLDFARPSDPVAKQVPAGKILDEIARLMRPELERSKIRLETPDSNGTLLYADYQQLKQVMINLIRNASDSIESGGTISLRATEETSWVAGMRKPVTTLEIADTGRGIPVELRSRLFDPFFTTKEGGTGLGLSIAARIIEKHGGELQFESNLDHGTTFKIVLPKHAPDESSHLTH